uniref:Hpt domain-containing protein n=1 Tax=Pseudomonas soli TaxID=1306993 RepID=UPI0028AAD500
MSFGADEEILQDFLVEAGEILEQLSEQLVELESRPDDADLLNAIFRGFHTVKGGAGFLQLNELVECCHIAENVFDILRKGERRVDAELMDVVLEALDTVNSMFGQVRERTDVTPATRELLAALSRLAEPAGAEEPAPVEVAVVAEVPAAEPDITDTEFEQLLDSLDAVKAEAQVHEQLQGEQVSAGGDEITDAEFESLLDQLHGKGQFSPDTAASEPAAVAPASDEITDDEFESLLDQLHGKGTFAVDALPGVAAPAASAAPAAADESITEHEFEALLDQLHGKGKFSGEAVVAEAPAAAVAAPVAAKAEAKPVAKPAPAPAPAAAKPA